MSVYLTASRGIGGQIRQQPKDFVVNEVYVEHRALDGRYQLVKVTKTDTETHHLVRDLSRRLRISQRRVSCCLLYTSDAADEEDSVDLGGSRIIKKKTTLYLDQGAHGCNARPEYNTHLTLPT